MVEFDLPKVAFPPFDGAPDQAAGDSGRGSVEPIGLQNRWIAGDRLESQVPILFFVLRELGKVGQRFIHSGIESRTERG